MSSGTSSRTAEGAVAEDHGDEAEHHVPEHRPADYAQLTEQLRARWTELCEPTGDSRAADAETRCRELGEIIDWIPEIAAESDLRRQEWEDVRRLGQELAQLYERNRSAAAEGTDAARPLRTSPEIDRLLDALDAYRTAARRDEPAVP